MFRSGCVTRTIGLRTLFGLVAAAQLFSWRASPPGFESSVLLLKDTRRGRRSPQPHSPSGRMGFQWSSLCTSPIMANRPTTLLAIGLSTCPNCECTSEESCIVCHQCVSYTIRECAHQQSPLHVDSRCAWKHSPVWNLWAAMISGKIFDKSPGLMIRSKGLQLATSITGWLSGQCVHTAHAFCSPGCRR